MPLPTTPEALRQLSPDQARELPPLLRALWHEAHNGWDAAHSIAQDIPSPDAARVHAYLHRREGDDWNARYWYRQANTPEFTGSLEEEWEALAAEFLTR